MDNWEPTKGKWNDYENYDIKEPEWKLALRYAGEQYNATGTYWNYKDGNEKKRIPYITFVQNVLKILIHEANLSDYYLLTLCALARLNELTGCTFEKLETMYSSGVIHELQEFPRKNTEDMIEYFQKVFNHNHKETTMYILFSELLFTLREEKCPTDDWEEDIKYYLEIERLVDKYLADSLNEKIYILCEKIKKQLLCNRDESRNRNKKPEELFEGWGDWD